MNLKKSDRLIAIIGVLVIVVAAIAIFFYSDFENGNGGNGGDDEKMLTFPVLCNERDRKASIDNNDFVVNDKIFGKQDYTGIVTAKDQYISKIDIIIDYEDDHYGLLGGRLLQQFGQDTLTVTVLDSNEQEVGTTTITGMGNDTITVDISSMGIDKNPEPIEAESRQAAEEILMDNFDEPEKEVSYTVQVSVSSGESPLRIFANLREKLFGNDVFTLEANYHYYEYVLDEPLEDDDGNDDNKDTGLENSENKNGGPAPYSTASLYVI
jgi:hypothetical protein